MTATITDITARMVTPRHDLIPYVAEFFLSLGCEAPDVLTDDLIPVMVAAELYTAMATLEASR